METTLTSQAGVAARARAAEGIRAEEFEDLVRLHQRRIYRVLQYVSRWKRNPASGQDARISVPSGYA